MPKINKIILNNFRNFNDKEIIFNKKSNILFGNNGSGKTNILEAISIISKGKGIRNASFNNLIKNSKNDFYINSIIEIKYNNYDIEIHTKKIEEKIKKITKVNGNSSKENINFLYSSLSFLIFLPEMERLFQSSPSYRRNFIDRLIFSEKNDYNKLINKYKKNIIERTKILQNNHFDLNWINYIEAQICEIGLQIYELRSQQLDLLNKHIDVLNQSNNYKFNIDLKIKDSFYETKPNQDQYISQLSSGRDFDRKFGGVKIGPHKSDIIATINNNYDATQLSTGQQKTVVLMMLLAQCDYLVNLKKINPILLLDEICSHLDSNNRQILLDLINQFDIQLFLTGTDKTLFSFISTNVQFYNITEL